MLTVHIKRIHQIERTTKIRVLARSIIGQKGGSDFGIA